MGIEIKKMACSPENPLENLGQHAIFVSRQIYLQQNYLIRLASTANPIEPQEYIPIENIRGRLLLIGAEVIDSENDDTKRRLVQAFSSDLIRFYYGGDMIGNEVGAAAKNVVGIAAGFLDGFEMSSLKGALMSRGTREVARLIKAMGGSELSAYGLCHLGDYEATVFSPYSHNRQFGEAFVRGHDYHQLAEGYYTVKALMLLGRRYGVELPICKAVHDILYEQAVPRDVLAGLLRRGLTEEFYD